MWGGLPMKREPCSDETNATATSRTTLVPGFDVEQLARDSQSFRPPMESGARVRVAPGGDASVNVRAGEIYWGRIAGAHRVPRLCVPARAVPDEWRGRCAGFILCRVDGRASVGEILAACGLPELTALCLICELLDMGILTLAEAPRLTIRAKAAKAR